MNSEISGKDVNGVCFAVGSVVYKVTFGVVRGRIWI